MNQQNEDNLISKDYSFISSFSVIIWWFIGQLADRLDLVDVCQTLNIPLSKYEVTELNLLQNGIFSV